MLKTLAAIVTVALISSGCMIGKGSFLTGDPLPEKQVKQIVPGMTTKQQILDWFGPPLAVARKGAIMKIPSLGPKKTEYQDVQADSFLELFSSKYALTERHIVYYYPATDIKSSETLFVFLDTIDHKVVTDRLWILIDDGTGIVVDYVYRKAL